jgi:5,5'-dehydrodivanillate O-demethylase
MLTPEENEALTRVGPGTPGGELMRRYWHPIAVASDLTPERPTKRVRVLGEDLIVYLGEDGTYNLMAEQCSHRGCSLYYGFVEGGAIRCPYHGWLYARDGTILEQPFEPEESLMKHRVRQAAYQVERLAGLLFAYMGPQPAPLLPRYDVLARPDGTRHIQVMPVLECNWLQAQENSLDPTHVYYLHGHTMVKKGVAKRNMYRNIEGYEFEQIEWGIVKRRTFGGGDNDEGYKEPGHPAVFPNILWHSMEGRDGVNPYDGTMPIDMHYRVPIDDTHTQVFWIGFVPSEDGTWGDPYEDDVPVEHVQTLKDERGDFHLKTFASQDHMAWETQGPVWDRSREHLGAGDKGIAMWRQLLKEQIDAVQAGRDPICTVREPQKNALIAFAPPRDLVGDRYAAREDTAWEAKVLVPGAQMAPTRTRRAAAPGSHSTGL